MHAKLASIWLACPSVLVKVIAHGVDLTLHATVSRVLCGNWHLLTPLILHSVVVCPTLSDPDNGNVELSGNTFGQIAECTCNTGYNLIGDALLICGSEGQWIGNSPVCNGRHLSITDLLTALCIFQHSCPVCWSQ